MGRCEGGDESQVEHPPSPPEQQQRNQSTFSPSHTYSHLGGDNLGDLSSDGLDRLLEGLLVAHAHAGVAAEERLAHAVDGAQQDAALAVNVRLVLRLEGGGWRERRGGGGS